MGFSTELPCDKAFGFRGRGTYERMREAPKMKNTIFFQLTLGSDSLSLLPLFRSRSQGPVNTKEEVITQGGGI